MYIQIKSNKNKNLVRCIDHLTVKTVLVITETSKLITYISAEIFVLLLGDKYILYYINT